MNHDNRISSHEWNICLGVKKGKRRTNDWLLTFMNSCLIYVYIFRGTSSAGQFSANWKKKRTESFKNLVKGRLTRTDTRWRFFPVIQCPSNCGALTASGISSFCDKLDFRSVIADTNFILIMTWKCYYGTMMSWRHVMSWRHDNVILVNYRQLPCYGLIFPFLYY